MANRYDSRTTTFSPEGRLFQVEYAIEAVGLSGTLIGLQSPQGLVLLAEKRTTSKLLDLEAFPEKIYSINDHIVCGVAGLTADANTLLEHARKYALSYAYNYGEPIPVEQLVQRMCDLKQSYTQFGGMRPFGVGMMIAGWDKYEGFQLYVTDPAGFYSSWKANCIGANAAAIQTSLKAEYGAGPSTLKEASMLALKVLGKQVEKSAMVGEKLELMTVESNGEGQVFCKFLPGKQIDLLVAEAVVNK